MPKVKEKVLGNCRLYLGDCLDVLPRVQSEVQAIISDPPWGIGANTDYTRFTNGLSDHRNYGEGIANDQAPFDPSAWIVFAQVALWGAHCFADKLPVGRWLVWMKKRSNQIGTFLSDGELAWVKKKNTGGPPGVYVYKQVWHGFDRAVERGKILHPTQKPVDLMKWTMQMADVPEKALVMDPYMGSGSTGVACVGRGLPFIGAELNPEYFQIACNRISQALDTPRLFS